MTELPHSRDDEIVSAVLDGVASPTEHALVAGDEPLRTRLDELRAVRDAVAQPVPSLDTLTARRLVATALATAPSGSRPRLRRTAAAAGSAAALLVAALVALPLLRDLGRGSDDTVALYHADGDEAPVEEGMEMSPQGEAAALAAPDDAAGRDDALWGEELLGDHPTFAELEAAAQEWAGELSRRSAPAVEARWCTERSSGELLAELLGSVEGREVVVVISIADAGEVVVELLDPVGCEEISRR